VLARLPRLVPAQEGSTVTAVDDRWSGEGANESCVWPTCAKHRVPCETKMVGRCVGVPCMTKGAVCYVGRCFCPEGYCGEPYLPHMGRCVPQVVYEGATPPSFEMGDWLRVFSSMGDPDRYPRLWELRDRWHQLPLSPTCRPAAALLVVGLAVAHLTGVAMCNRFLDCVWCSRRSPDGPFVFCAVQRRKDESPSERWSRGGRRCIWPAGAAVMVFVICAAGLVTRSSNWEKGVHIISAQVRHLSDNSANLLNRTQQLNDTASNLSTVVQKMAKCKRNPLMSHVGSRFVDATTDLAHMVHVFDKSIRDVKNEAIRFRDRQQEQGHYVWVWWMCFPLVLMCVLSLAMMVEVVSARYSFCLSRRAERSSAFYAFFFVPTIGLLALIFACMLSSIIGLSQICRDVDDNFIRYAEDLSILHGDHGTIANVARFYLRGDIFNPLDHYADLIENYIDAVHEVYKEFKTLVIIPQGYTCSALHELDVPGIHAVVRAVIGTARGVLNATNVYPYYQESIRGYVCNHVPSAVGTFLVWQVLVGLFFFPLTAVATHQYLHHATAQKEMLMRGASEGEASDSDSDDVENSETVPTYFTRVT